ncbi:hypothetical protein [Kitasatospora sp. NPDC097691]
MIDIEEPAGADPAGGRLPKVTAAWHHHGDDGPAGAAAPAAAGG